MINIRARHNLSSAVHCWDAAATISCVRDVMVLLLPSGSGELDDEG
jgi:hypothetical protein